MCILGCAKDTSKEVQPGWWNANADFGSFDFRVDSSSTYITEINYTFSDWHCGGTISSGSIIVSRDPAWAITGRQFEIETDIGSPSIEKSITISGTFAETGDQASGTWEAVVNSTTCSGSWQASPEGK